MGVARGHGLQSTQHNYFASFAERLYHSWMNTVTSLKRKNN